MIKVKPDFIEKWNIGRFSGYVGVYCKCGKFLYVKNVPEKARQHIIVECPCGFEIETIYTGEQTNGN